MNYLNQIAVQGILNIKIDDEQKKYAEDQVNKTDFGSGLERAGTKRNQFVGILGETIICDLLEKVRPDGSNGYDLGIDFYSKNGTSFDVKTMRRTTMMRWDFDHNYYEAQFNHVAEYLIFNSYCTTTNLMQVCGYLNSKDLYNKCKKLKKGERVFRTDGKPFVAKDDLLMVPQENLEHFTILDNFKYKIEGIE